MLVKDILRNRMCGEQIALARCCGSFGRHDGTQYMAVVRATDKNSMVLECGRGPQHRQHIMGNSRTDGIQAPTKVYRLRGLTRKATDGAISQCCFLNDDLMFNGNEVD